MRRIVVSEFVSLDGVVEDPGWTFRFGSEEQERFKLDELTASDVLLLRRVTYEGFADMMNGYPKHVALSARDSRVTTEDGGVAKSGDVLAGLVAVDVPDVDTALDWAQRIPTARYGKIGVRPIVEWEE